MDEKELEIEIRMAIEANYELDYGFDGENEYAINTLNKDGLVSDIALLIKQHLTLRSL